MPVGFLVLLFGAVAVAQQPVINAGPLNAASVGYSQAGEPSAGIAQGSMFIVKGSGFGTCGVSVATSFPLKTTMGTTSMKITMAGNTYNVFMYYVVACNPNAPDQLAGILPSNTPVGLGDITVTNNGRASATARISVVARRFGIYARNGNGTGPLIVQNFNSATDQPVNTLVESAHPQQSEILWGNGLGAISGDDSVPPAGGDMNIPVDVFVGGKPADIAYKGRTVYPSVDVIVFKVPDGVQGCYVPVSVRVAGVMSNFGTISVTPSGKACSDPAGLVAADLQKPLNGATLTVADVFLARIGVKATLSGMGNFQGNLDFADGHFRRYGSVADLLTSVNRGSIGGIDGAFPSLACAVTAFTFNDFLGVLLGGDVDDPINSQTLDAGAALNLAGPLGAKQLPRGNSGGGFGYGPPGTGLLGGGIPGFPGVPPVTPDYLQAGAYTLNNGSGGAAVGGFSTSLTIPANPLVWTNQDALNSIPRSQDLTVTWSGGAAGGYVGVFGASADPATGAGAQFSCVASAGAGSFTVPAWVLSALPASGADPATGGTPVGSLTLANTLVQPVRFQATGIDVGFFNWAALQVKNVNFQ